MTSPGTEVFVEAPARLHFGVLDLRGELGRWFGGIGAAAPEATLLLSASKALTVSAHGLEAARVSAFAKRFLDHHHIRALSSTEAYLWPPEPPPDEETLLELLERELGAHPIPVGA